MDTRGAEHLAAAQDTHEIRSDDDRGSEGT